MPKATEPKNNPKNKSQVYLFSEVNVTPSKSENEPRQFNGIANSGKPFDYYGVRVIVDLENISYQAKVPVLMEHDRAKRAGVGVIKVENNQLLISGTLLNNEHGKQVAEDADDEFPWQMSAHVIAGGEKILKAEETAVINGQTVTAPITILQNCRIPEVSFTPTGIDDQTSAVILGDDGSNSLPNPQKDNTMNAEELQKLLDAEKAKNADLVKENETLKAENETLKAENAKLKESANQANVDAQLSQAGFTKSEDGKFNGLSDGTYNMLLSATADNAKAMIGDLKLSQANQTPTPAKPALPSVLLGEQYPAGQTQGVQLSDNPLVANAQARSQQQKSYI